MPPGGVWPSHPICAHTREPGEGPRRRGNQALNPRQFELLLYALRHPESESTTTSHQWAQGFDDQTAHPICSP